MPKVTRYVVAGWSVLRRTLGIAVICFLLLLMTFDMLSWVVQRNSREEFQNGVMVDLDNVRWAEQDSSLTTIGYAETGRRAPCHVATGSLLLRAEKIRRVLTMVRSPLCNSAIEDGAFRGKSADRLPRARLFYARAFWLERNRNAEGSSNADAIEVTEGSPWDVTYLINCSPGRRIYSLRTWLPDLFYGGSRFEPVARVRFFFGTCLDPDHWPMIESLIELVGSLDRYKPSARTRSGKMDASAR